MAREHPLEIDAAIDTVRVSRNRGVVRETLAHCQHARQQQRRVDGRELALPLACAGVEVDEVVVPAALLLHVLGEKPYRSPRTIEDLRARQPAALGGNAHPCQPESDRCDAADVA